MEVSAHGSLARWGPWWCAKAVSAHRERVVVAEGVPARGPNEFGNYQRIVDAGQSADNPIQIITDRWGTVVNMFPVE